MRQISTLGIDTAKQVFQRFCQVVEAETLIRQVGSLPGPPRPLGGPLRTCNFSPTRESLPHLVAILRRGQPMPPGAEVLGNGTVCGQKALGMPR